MSRPKESASLRFLYNSLPGRICLRLLTARWVSRLCGSYMDSSLSKKMIPKFIRKNNIDLSQYEETEYTCFNDFFTRKIRPELRPVDPDPEAFIAPCDGLLSAYRIREGSVFPIKQSEYTVSSLLGGNAEADRFIGGICLVFRLCVDHYHRYAYVDEGTKGENVFIPGRLHTVRPIALGRYPVFAENCREYTLMATEHFGTVAQIEVGAMLVGKIANSMGVGATVRGAEKGRFLYGGSTIVLLLEPGAVDIDDGYFKATEAEEETPVKLGQRLGRSINVKNTTDEEKCINEH